MNVQTRWSAIAGVLLLSISCLAAGQVTLPCDPKDCPPIDPCKINPDRCKDKGGPINLRSEREPLAFNSDQCISSCDMYYDRCIKSGNTNQYCNGQHNSCVSGCLKRK
jgi:hypothetical protein